MKEMLLLLILSSLASRLNATKRIDDSDAQALVRKLAYSESNKALRVVL